MQSLEERVMNLEIHLSDHARYISVVGGTNRAFQDAFFALLPFYEKYPDARKAIELSLEETTSRNLGDPNQTYVDAYDKAATSILSAMNGQ